MALSTQRAVSDGTLVYLDLSIEYMKRADITVFMNDLPADPNSWVWVGSTDKRIKFTPAVPDGVEVLIKRTTKIVAVQHKFELGAKFNNRTMDENFLQLLYLNQEAVEGAALTDIFNDVDFHGYRIRNLGPAQNDNEGITLGQVKDMTPGPWQAKVQAEAARDKAKEWATKPAAVELGLESSKTYADRSSASAAAAAGSANSANTHKVGAQAAQVAAEASAGTAYTNATLAGGSADLAKQWASHPVDQPVANGEYSSKHYAAKSELWAQQAGEVPNALAQVSAAVRAMYSGMVGVPIPWPTGTVPTGYLAMDGSSFNTSENPLLAARYPNGVLPDLRRQFIRGANSEFGVLTRQTHALGSHGHSARADSGGDHEHDLSGSVGSAGAHTHPLSVSSVQFYLPGSPGNRNSVMANQTGGTAVPQATSAGAHTHTLSGKAALGGAHSHTVTVDPTGDVETRPDNVAFLWVCMTDKAIPQLPNIGA